MLTLVFFILHLSQAFHTLLFLASAIETPYSCEHDVLFDIRLVGLVTLVDLLTDGLLCSSSGGVGSPDIIDDLYSYFVAGLGRSWIT